MSVIIPRSAWNPRYSDGSDFIGTSAWKDIFVHHTVTHAGPDELQDMRNLESIGETNFGQGISYTVVVFPSGNAYQGHSLTTRGAHTYMRNDSSRAIAFVGNFDLENPTDAALNKAALILREWRGDGYPSVITGGHRDVYPTDCPGDNLYSLLAHINRMSYNDIPEPIENKTNEGETMFILKKDGAGAGTLAMLNGGLVSGLDPATAESAHAANNAAGGSLFISVTDAVWKDLVGKSQQQERIEGAVVANTAVLREVLAELKKLPRS